ncbi:MAG: hypothetical protein EOO38_32465, partial [Cytophagaceae bacterium]
MCDGYVSFGVGNPSTFVKSSARFNDGIYHLMTATRNKTTGEIQLYIDATLQGTATGNTSSLNSATNLYLGALNSGASDKYVGQLDEFYVWTSVLTPTQIRLLYERQRPSWAGIYYSRIMDARIDNSPWTGMKWTSSVPAGKELPDFNGTVQNESIANYPAVSTNSLMTSNVGLWHLNETTPGIVTGAKDFKDSSGNDNHGVAQNTIGMGGMGRFNNGVEFRQGGEIKVAANPALALGTGSFTVSTWFRVPLNAPARSRLITSGFSAQSNGFTLEVNPGKIAFGIGCGGQLAAECVYAFTTAAFRDDLWHQATAVVDQTAKTLVVYV